MGSKHLIEVITIIWVSCRHLDGGIVILKSLLLFTSQLLSYGILLVFSIIFYFLSC